MADPGSSDSPPRTLDIHTSYCDLLHSLGNSVSSSEDYNPDSFNAAQIVKSAFPYLDEDPSYNVSELTASTVLRSLSQRVTYDSTLTSTPLFPPSFARIPQTNDRSSKSSVSNGSDGLSGAEQPVFFKRRRNRNKKNTNDNTLVVAPKKPKMSTITVYSKVEGDTRRPRRESTELPSSVQHMMKTDPALYRLLKTGSVTISPVTPEPEAPAVFSSKLGAKRRGYMQVSPGKMTPKRALQYPVTNKLLQGSTDHLPQWQNSNSDTAVDYTIPPHKLTKKTKLPKQLLPAPSRLYSVNGNSSTTDDDVDEDGLALHRWKRPRVLPASSKHFDPSQYLELNLVEDHNKPGTSKSKISNNMKSASSSTFAIGHSDTSADGVRDPYSVLMTDEERRRKYQCTKCDKMFNWSTDLKRHYLTHTGERPFVCPVCFANFTRKFLMEKHIVRQHSELNLYSQSTTAKDNVVKRSNIPSTVTSYDEDCDVADDEMDASISVQAESGYEYYDDQDEYEDDTPEGSERLMDMTIKYEGEHENDENETVLQEFTAGGGDEEGCDQGQDTFEGTGDFEASMTSEGDDDNDFGDGYGEDEAFDELDEDETDFGSNPSQLQEDDYMPDNDMDIDQDEIEKALLTISQNSDLNTKVIRNCGQQSEQGNLDHVRWTASVPVQSNGRHSQNNQILHPQFPVPLKRLS